MEFTYKNYLVRFIRNASDSILRLEETSTHKLYETTLYERDVLEYTALGGIEFVSGLIAQGLNPAVDEDGFADETLVKTTLESEKEALTLTFSHQPAFVSKAIVVTLRLPSIRRVSAAEDTEGLGRRIRELEAKMGRLVQYVEALEDRAGGIVVIAGGGPPCPVDASSVSVCVSSQAYNQGAPNGAYKNRWGKDYFHMSIWTGAETEGLDSLKGFQYLTKCTSLVIGGCHRSLVDFSALGSMTELQSLTITADVCHDGISPCNNQARPQLTDISWISNLKKLRILNLHGCQKLVDLTPLKGLLNLISLKISQTAVTNTDWISVSMPKCVIVK